MGASARSRACHRVEVRAACNGKHIVQPGQSRRHLRTAAPRRLDLGRAVGQRPRSGGLVRGAGHAGVEEGAALGYQLDVRPASSASSRHASSGSARARKSSCTSCSRCAAAVHLLHDLRPDDDPNRRAARLLYAAVVAVAAVGWQYGLFSPTRQYGRCSFAHRWCRCSDRAPGRAFQWQTPGLPPRQPQLA